MESAILTVSMFRCSQTVSYENQIGVKFFWDAFGVIRPERVHSRGRPRMSISSIYSL
jgi:hypothetical protein